MRNQDGLATPTFIGNMYNITSIIRRAGLVTYDEHYDLSKDERHIARFDRLDDAVEVQILLENNERRIERLKKRKRK